MNVVVMSDTHMPGRSRRLPRALVAELERADLIVHAGDFSTAEVLADLRELGPVTAVHGNVDSPALRQELPESISLELENVVLGVIHDAGPARGRLERLRTRFPDADAVVFGHSHRPYRARLGRVLLFNPGSAGPRRFSLPRTVGLLRLAPDRIDARIVHLD